jgi:Domain of unknown function (DUF397)
VTGKPTVEDLGIDVDAQTWMASGGPDGAIEVASTGEWVLMRVADDPARRVLVYDRFEWDCFVDGVKNGEFDDGAELLAISPEWPARSVAVTIPID